MFDLKIDIRHPYREPYPYRTQPVPNPRTLYRIGMKDGANRDTVRYGPYYIQIIEKTESVP